MACDISVERARLYTNPDGTRTLEIEVGGCSQGVHVAPAIGLPLEADVDPTDTTNHRVIDGRDYWTCSFDVSTQAPVCKSFIKVDAHCLDDPQCGGTFTPQVECFGTICPRPNTAGMDVTLPSGATVSAGNMISLLGQPGPHCHLDGEYTFKLLDVPPDTAIVWKVYDYTDSNNTMELVSSPDNGTQTFRYSLPPPEGRIPVVVRARLELGPTYEGCPEGIDDVDVHLLPCESCAAQGLVTGPGGKCQSPCKADTFWDQMLQKCSRRSPPIPAPPPHNPPPHCFVCKLCDCENMWCLIGMPVAAALLAALLLSIAWGELHITDPEVVESYLLTGLATLAQLHLLLQAIGCLAIVMVYWTPCGSCCTRCMLALSIALALAGGFAVWAITGVPPTNILEGFLAIAVIGLAAASFAYRCKHPFTK